MSTNKVVKKIVSYISVKFLSPVCISNGEEELTDKDVLRDYSGNPFIAGSSLAGVMRGYLGKGKEEDCLFGYSDLQGEKGKMSSVFVSDLYFTREINTMVRDGIALTEKKVSQTGAKYEMEVIDSGAEGYFIVEFIIREGQDEEEKLLEQWYQILYGFQNHEIRLGTRKTRGYGEVEITAIRQKEYTKENIQEYIDAYQIEKAMKEFPNILQETMDRIKNNRKKITEKSKYIRIDVPLRLKGAISIRKYATKKGEPDFVHITAGDKPVIPGTSFAGALRHRISEFLKQVKCKQANYIIADIFGYTEKDKAHQSNIIIGESIIENAVPLTMVRNGISRFESSAKNGALYKERSYVGGTTILTIYIKRINEEDNKWECKLKPIIGLLLTAIKDIQNGYLSIGGQTAIGRGVFQENGSILLDGKEVEENQYFQDMVLEVFN